MDSIICRNSWVFNYTITEVKDAAIVKVAYHKNRLEYWKKQKDDKLVEIKESGIDINESLGLKMTNYGKGSMSASVTIDEKMQEDLLEAVGAIEKHTNKVAEYQLWVDTLAKAEGSNISAPPRLTLELKHDDVVYFFGK